MTIAFLSVAMTAGTVATNAARDAAAAARPTGSAPGVKPSGEALARARAFADGTLRRRPPLPRHVAPDPDAPKPRIVNGDLDTVSNWPWIASLRDVDLADGAHLCGGSLIDVRWVLTAAHCVDLGILNPDVVVLGQTRFSDSTGQQIDIDAIVTWPFGDTTDGQPRDIAMLHLAADADIARPEIEPIPLLSATDSSWAAAGATAHTAGWGVISEFDFTTPDRLRSTTVDVVGDHRCGQAYERFDIEIDGASWVCGMTEAQPPSSLGRGPCFGDSGGPLVVFDPGDPSLAGARLIGATSFGIECGSPTFPSVWAQTSVVRDEIAGVIAGSIDLSDLTIDITGGAATVTGTADPDFLPIYCANEFLWIGFVRANVGGTPEPCGGSAITSLSISTGGRADEVLLVAIDPESMAGLSVVGIDLGPDPPSDRFDDLLAMFVPTTAPSNITSVGGAIDLGADGPVVALSGVELAVMLFGDGDDTIDLSGIATPTEMDTGGGDDTVTGTSSNDLVYSGEGNDVVDGDDGDDTVLAASGNDTVHGGRGNDTLFGMEDIDNVFGDAGTDTLGWGFGDSNDRLSGGNGSDTVDTAMSGYDFFFGEEEELVAPRIAAAQRVRRFLRRHGLLFEDLFGFVSRTRVVAGSSATVVRFDVAFDFSDEFFEDLPPELLELFEELFGGLSDQVRIADAETVLISGDSASDDVRVNGPTHGLPNIRHLVLGLRGGSDTVRTPLFHNTGVFVDGGRGRDTVRVEDPGVPTRVTDTRVTASGYSPVDTDGVEVLLVV